MVDRSSSISDSNESENDDDDDGDDDMTSDGHSHHNQLTMDDNGRQRSMEDIELNSNDDEEDDVDDGGDHQMNSSSPKYRDEIILMDETESESSSSPNSEISVQSLELDQPIENRWWNIPKTNSVWYTMNERIRQLLGNEQLCPCKTNHCKRGRDSHLNLI